MTGGRVAAVLGVLLATVMLAGRVPSPARAAEANPTVSVTPATARPGEPVIVKLAGWKPYSSATAAVCGNQARRGSQDCVMANAEGIGVDPPGTGGARLYVALPPVPCPCVIRAASATSDVVVTTPIDIPGAPTGPPIAAGGPAAASDVAVKAKVVTPDTRWPASWGPPLGGSTKKVLVLTLHNEGSSTLSALRLVANVGRNTREGEPVASQKLPVVPSGASVTTRVPVELSAPAFGHYVVYGTVYGLATPVPFRAKTSNDSWGWMVLLPMTLLLVAQVIRARDRRRRRAETESSAELAEPPSSAEAFPECSPGVGGSDAGRWTSTSYDQPHDDTAPVSVASAGRTIAGTR